jgi:hypothetical protein
MVCARSGAVVQRAGAESDRQNPIVDEPTRTPSLDIGNARCAATFDAAIVAAQRTGQRMFKTS